MYKIQLRLPKIKFTAEQAHKVTPQGVEEWLQKIDFSSNLKAHVHFLETLKKINRIDLEVDIRMEVMMVLEPAIETILTETIYKSTNANNSLNEKNLAVSKQIQFMLLEIAAAHKIIIKQITENDDLMAKHLGNYLPQACYKAIHSLSCLLIERYQKYLSEPDYIWFELNQIYHMSERLGIYDLELENQQTILSEYLRISVIRISDPYRLMPVEIRKLHKLMANLTQYCQIENIANNDIKLFHIVDLNKGQAPNNYWAYQQQPQEELRLFKLEALKLHIDSQLRNKQEKTDTHAINARLDREMLLRFRQQLSYLGSQKEERLASHEKVSLVIGMTACHYFIRDEKAFDPEKEMQTIRAKAEKKETQTKKDFSLSELSLVSLGDENVNYEKKSRIEKLRKINPFFSEDMLVEDSWDQINSSNVANAQVNSGSYTQTLDDLYREEFWQEKNKSDGGMMLFRDSQSSNILQVGMLIAYRRNLEESTSNEKKYHLGIIRWLRIDLKKGVIIGIYNIANECDAVAVKAAKGVGTGSDYNQALLFSSQHASSQHSTVNQSTVNQSTVNQSYLLVPSGIYDTNTVLELWYKEKLIQVKISHKIMTTNTITQVKFEVLST